jgi:hypothetical protein
MVVPYAHLDGIEKLPDAVRDELFRVTAAMAARIKSVLNAEGINIGMNLGKCAGAGIAEHLHLPVENLLSPDGLRRGQGRLRRSQLDPRLGATPLCARPVAVLAGPILFLLASTILQRSSIWTSRRDRSPSR